MKFLTLPNPIALLHATRPNLPCRSVSRAVEASCISTCVTSVNFDIDDPRSTSLTTPLPPSCSIHTQPAVERVSYTLIAGDFAALKSQMFVQYGEGNNCRPVREKETRKRQRRTFRTMMCVDSVAADDPTVAAFRHHAEPGWLTMEAR
jgi:hypothetical protein